MAAHSTGARTAAHEDRYRLTGLVIAQALPAPAGPSIMLEPPSGGGLGEGRPGPQG
jgi:hypothetical protein